MMNPSIRSIFLAGAMALVAETSPLSAQTAPAAPTNVLPGPDAGEPALLELRRHLLDPALMPLIFHTMDSAFHSQPVANGAHASPLPRDERPLDFTYEYGGKTLPADAIFNDTYTSALLIVKDGRIVFERYRNLTNDHTRFLAMSMSKSVTSILVGIAVDHGSIRSLDQQITDYVPELKGTPYEGVTIRDAIDMKTGVDRSDGDQLKPGTDGARRREEILVRNARPAVDEARMVGRKAEPGKAFDYSTLNTTILGWVLERAVKTPIADYTSKMLWQPLGAEQPAFWVTDGPGSGARPLTGIGFNATLRDYARIGLLMLNDGQIDGRRILSKRWVDEATDEPHAPIAPNAPTGYQHSWWTVPGSPAYAANGVGGQYIYVDPATRTVIVKLSYVPNGVPQAGSEANAFFKAASAWKPR